MKTAICTITLALLAALPLHADDYTSELWALASSAPVSRVAKFIDQSYAANKNDPSYYAASANYWWKQAQELSISTRPAEPGGIMITDPETGNEVGSVSAGPLNPQYVANAIKLLRAGYKQFPYRLDFGIGQANMLRETGKQKECVEVLKQVLRNSTANPSALRWTEGASLPGPPGQFIPSLMQDYTWGFFDSDTPKGRRLGRELCEAIIRAYPDHVYAYNVLGGIYKDEGDDAASLKYFALAHQIAPDDEIVMVNLANAYIRSGDTKKAERLFNQALAAKPDKEVREIAERGLNYLKGRQ